MWLCCHFNGQNSGAYLKDPERYGGGIILKRILRRVATTGICDQHLVCMCGDKLTIW